MMRLRIKRGLATDIMNYCSPDAVTHRAFNLPENKPQLFLLLFSFHMLLMFTQNHRGLFLMEPFIDIFLESAEGQSCPVVSTTSAL